MKKKISLFITFMVIALGLGTGTAFGYQVYVDAIDDAGTYAGEAAYATFKDTVWHGNAYGDWYVNTTQDKATSQWTSAQNVYDYMGYHSLTGNWWLLSAGNIWSADKIVGESLLNMHAGTYHITPVQATYLAFQRDTFNWTNPNYYGVYWWSMLITATNVYVDGELQASYTFTLGSETRYSSAEDAFNAVVGSYLDITLAEGGTLTFYIYDVTTVDNGGGLTVEVTMVPEPSTLLLLLLGIPFVVRKFKR